MTLRRSFFWSFTQQFGIYALQFVNLIVIARLLSPTEIGVFLIAVSINAMLGQLRDMGLSTYIVQTRELTAETLRTVFGLSILMVTVFAAILLAATPVLMRLYGSPGIADIMPLLVGAALLTPLGMPAEAMLTRQMRFRGLATIALAARSVGVGLSIGLALAGASYMALAWGFLAEAAARAVGALALSPGHLRLRPGLANWRGVMRFGGPVTLAALLGRIASEGNKLIIGYGLDLAQVSLYDRAQRLPLIARGALFIPISRVLMPAFSRALRNGEAIGPQVARLLAYSGALIWPAFLVLGLLSEPVVLLLFGANWSGAIPVLPWLLAANAMSVLLPQPEPILLPHTKPWRLVALRGIQLVSSIGLGLLAVSYGLEAYAATRVLSAAIFIGVLWVVAGRFMEVSVTRIAALHVRSGALALLTALPTLGLHLSGVSGLALLAGAALAPLFWLAGLRGLSHPLWDELVGLWTRWRAVR